MEEENQTIKKDLLNINITPKAIKAAGSAADGVVERVKRGEDPSGADPTIDKSVRLAPCHSLAVAAKIL